MLVGQVNQRQSGELVWMLSEPSRLHCLCGSGESGGVRVKLDDMSNSNRNRASVGTRDYVYARNLVHWMERLDLGNVATFEM